MKRVSLSVGFFVLLFLSGVQSASAVKLEAGEWDFGINGFMDGVYTWMSNMPMVMTNSSGMQMAGKMPEQSSLDQEHMNLLFGVKRNKIRVNINVDARNNYTSEGDGRGNLKFEEIYGEYTLNDFVRIRTGTILAPFGLYNSVRYITPLFATVVLPQMYEMPGNYDIGTDSINKNFTPSKASFMLSGDYLGDSTEINYYLYISNGKRAKSGRDENLDKGFGGRLRGTFLDNYKLGFSYYTVKNDEDSLGQERLYGADIELNLEELLKFEAEYVLDNFGKRKNRHTYYARLTAYIGTFSPFVAYDYADDDANALYKRGQTRYSVGTGYNVSNLVTIKAEYHYHKFSDKDTAPALVSGTDTIDMFRASVIYVF